MKNVKVPFVCLVAGALALVFCLNDVAASEATSSIPRFSIANMDRSVEPANDFYRFAAGTWLKNNPVPPDKSRWSGFEELQQRNWQLVRDILETSATDT